ncbi:MAG TPA: type III-B CRISPR module-associated protein Cmr5 [Chitinophagales bacterium]|nr:type III-B CRISPR module-associated protein Cmr5 [Chitinophagales bacterium]
MKNIEKILPTAIDAVKKFVIPENQSEVPKEFNGYISSFGASVISSGLLPTIVFFSQAGKSKGDRRSVINALEYIVSKEFPGTINTNEKIVSKVTEMVKANQSMNRLEEKLNEAAIALKLAIRIFPKSKKDSNHE